MNFMNLNVTTTTECAYIWHGQIQLGEIWPNLKKKCNSCRQI